MFSKPGSGGYYLENLIGANKTHKKVLISYNNLSNGVKIPSSC